MAKVVMLPSGAKLEITLSPFAISRALYQVVAEELKSVKVSSADDMANLLKDSFCTILSSKKIEAALDECMNRVAYNGQKVNAATWEPLEARQDYLEACLEVAKENLIPFGKALFAKYSVDLEKLKSFLA